MAAHAASGRSTGGSAHHGGTPTRSKTGTTRRHHRFGQEGHASSTGEEPPPQPPFGPLLPRSRLSGSFARPAEDQGSQPVSNQKRRARTRMLIVEIQHDRGPAGRCGPKDFLRSSDHRKCRSQTCPADERARPSGRSTDRSPRSDRPWPGCTTRRPGNGWTGLRTPSRDGPNMVEMESITADRLGSPAVLAAIPGPRLDPIPKLAGRDLLASPRQDPPRRATRTTTGADSRVGAHCPGRSPRSCAPGPAAPCARAAVRRPSLWPAISSSSRSCLPADSRRSPTSSTSKAISRESGTSQT